jgi:glycosyltransferase involved in cell wall biosynthesis
MERHRVAIVIPAFNEAGTIGRVVEQASGFGRPIVVDDGSSDGTAEAARAAGADVVEQPRNGGYDAALNAGFARASAIGCDYVITIDADGQHDPQMLQRFAAMLDQGADVVIGTRPRRARIAESLFAAMTLLRWGIRDPLCGLKGYRLDVYRELGHFDCSGSIGTELSLFAVRAGKTIVQHPVPVFPRQGQTRFGAGLRANWRILKALGYAAFPALLRCRE